MGRALAFTTTYVTKDLARVCASLPFNAPSLQRTSLPSPSLALESRRTHSPFLRAAAASLSFKLMQVAVPRKEAPPPPPAQTSSPSTREPEDFRITIEVCCSMETLYG